LSDKLFPIERTATGGYRLRETVCSECAGTYTLPYSNHLRSPEHRAWVEANQQKLVPIETIPEEPTMPLEDGQKLVFGEMRVCPRCRGTLRPARKDRKGGMLPADTFTHDPIDKDGRCQKCGGTGVVEITRSA
jgi:hypothetical protein